MKTVKEFMQKNKGGYYIYAAEDISGFCKKGNSCYGDCDHLTVVNWLYNPLNGIYTLYVKN